MDAVVYTALEEICSQGSTGIPLRTLWSKINHNLQINGLNLCNNVKKAIWLNLLNIPSLNFECNGVLFDSGNPKIQMVDECEAMDLKIVAKECLLNNFVGIYDIKASDAGVSQPQRRTLERLAIARTDGITQNELAKEFDIENKNIFYILRNLESRGLIVRQSTIIRKKEAGNEEYKNGSIINTNMLHLYRYAKHLGHLQRLEITKGDNSSINDDNAGREIAIKDGVSKERIEDFVPAITAICDRLEKADGKVLVVSDLKIELGYRKTRGHRTWRNILQKLKDANLVEEFFATVNNKPVSCVRLLKKFSPTTCASKSHGGGDDDLDTENVKLVKRGQITDQLFELPIEQQIYDMIDAEGSKGLILNDVYKRLAINNKRYYHRILDMVSRFGMHLDSEGLNKGVVYRVWTSGNFNKKVPNILPTDEKLSIHAETGQLMLTHTVHDVDEEQVINPISSTNDTWLDSNNLQCEASDVITDAEHQIVTVKPVSDSVSLEISSSASPIRRIRRSYTTYPCLGLNLVTSQREQRILEKLQEDKVLLKPELRRLLESLENKHTEMDKRTLERILNKLQKEGHCKCISFTVPSITNCSRTRTVDVILHPSVYKANDLSDRVHEKLRSFDWQLRDQSYSRYKLGKCKPIPVLNDVERISTSVKIDVQSETHEAMKNNGFVLAKMVRAKLLHVFLWGYLTVLPSWDDEQKNPHSSCKLLELDAAIKVMPLELFLQVAGSTLQLESMVEKCKNGIRLSDLSIQEYRSLMDTRATARLSYLIDILRRLKLIRLIGGSVPVGPHTTLRHSLELKPYIEEPVGMILPSTGVSSDLRPHHRHDFVLATRKSVDEYWNTLEYCYAASDPKAALHAFPGSAVVEVFHARSWASVRVMTAHQRAELVKIVANDDSDKKITYKKCEKIAENLNLTLEQVLRVYYDKREKDKSKREKDKSKRACKRKRSSKHKSLNNEKTEITLEEEESGKNKHAKLLGPEDDATEEQNSSQRLLEYNETSMFTDEIDGQKDVVNDDHEIIEDMHKCALPKLNCSRQKRFLWTENHDRQLVIEYVKHRVVLGAKFHRTDWASIENLPGPPNTCRRRVSTLRKNIQFKKALLGLCNMLSVRYAKHLETSKNKSVVGDYRMITNDLNIEERWDDFENNDIRMILDEVFKYKQVAKSEVTKDAQYVSKYPKSNVVVGAEGHELDENNLCSSSTHMNELNKDGRKRKASVRRSRKRLPKSCLMIMNKVKDFGTQVYKSLAVSNAIELFKLIFLSTAKAPEIPNLLAETLRRYSEHDLFTAFNYLRDKSFMVRGNDISHFVLSQPFLHSISSSPFPVNTGKRADKMSNWLHENENDLLETGLDLSADLQCGDVLQLCVLMCNGEISIFSCLPDEGVGEIDDLKKRKCDEIEVCSVEIASKKPKLSDNEIFSRKEKGFPGIQLSITRSLISRDDTITLSSYNSSSSKRVEGIIMSNDASESTWESMTFYARNLTSSTQEQSLLNPTLFKTVYSAIKNAGDQGLSVEGISQIIDMQGEDNAELIVEVLEAFGRVLKVNAYDSVNVVESLYRSKYRLTSMAIHHHKLPENNEENNEKNLISESPKTADVVEVHASTNEVHHRVTILNHTEEASQPINEVESNNEIEIMSPKTGPQEEEKCEFRVGEYSCFKPILPWVNGDGTVNKIVYKGLVRRVLGIVMQNPGILEEHVSSQMDVLNPQSCKRLLELMILDSLITVRKMYESVSHEPPAILGTLLGCNLKKPKMVCKEHLFANPNSIGYL